MSEKTALAMANNDVVYLWWSVPRKIPNCLGFSIRRIVDGKEEPRGLTATVGFDSEKDLTTPGLLQETENLPVHKV